MRRHYWVVVALVGMSCTVQAGEALEIECHAESTVYFSSTDAPDRISAEVRGGYCEDAVFRVVITDSTGKRIFEHENPLTNYMSCGWVNDNPERSRRIYTSMVSGAVSLKSTSDYRCDRPKQQGCTDSPAAERLRQRTAPAVCFSPTSDATLCYAFDSEEDKVVKIYGFSL